jgi:hypothetical protein
MISNLMMKALNQPSTVDSCDFSLRWPLTAGCARCLFADQHDNEDLHAPIVGGGLPNLVRHADFGFEELLLIRQVSGLALTNLNI